MAWYYLERRADNSETLHFVALYFWYRMTYVGVYPKASEGFTSSDYNWFHLEHRIVKLSVSVGSIVSFFFNKTSIKF
jgi:hypothetical protein